MTCMFRCINNFRILEHIAVSIRVIISNYNTPSCSSSIFVLIMIFFLLKLLLYGFRSITCPLKSLALSYPTKKNFISVFNTVRDVHSSPVWWNHNIVSRKGNLEKSLCGSLFGYLYWNPATWHPWMKTFKVHGRKMPAEHCLQYNAHRVWIFLQPERPAVKIQ